MAVRRVAARREEVVEDDELLRQRVGVRCHVAAVHDEARVSVSPRQIAEHLVVRAILLDDEYHVADRGRLSRSLGNRTRGLIRARDSTRGVGADARRGQPIVLRHRC